MVHAKTPDTVRLYHKPTCSKSREAKKVLDGLGVPYEEIRYIETPPSYDELKVIAKVLDGDVRDLLRDREAREAGWDADGNARDEEILQFIADHPEVMQRPILVRGDRAVIGRPTERIYTLLPEAGKDKKHTPTKNTASSPGPASGEHVPPRQYGRR